MIQIEDYAGSLSEREITQAEWDAWQLVVKHWPGDINNTEFNLVVKAIQLWGEYLVILRVKQDQDTRDRALQSYQTQYRLALDIAQAQNSGR